MLRFARFLFNFQLRTACVCRHSLSSWGCHDAKPFETRANVRLTSVRFLILSYIRSTTGRRWLFVQHARPRKSLLLSVPEVGGGGRSDAFTTNFPVDYFHQVFFACPVHPFARARPPE